MKTGLQVSNGNPAQRKACVATAGRICPRDYRYDPTVFARPAELATEVLYVAGGLYGNFAALDAIEALAIHERTRPTIVFNGDFHWFDAERDWFAEVDARVAQYRAVRGNVETELAREDDVGAGCGCVYPASVGDDVVQRSNQVLSHLQVTARAQRHRLERLRKLSMHLVAEVADVRVGIIHGDAHSLAGWSFAREALDEPGSSRWLDQVRRRSRIDVFASTHTCLAALRQFELPHGRLTVINNGAAGMPNFSRSRCGLISRIASRASPVTPVYGMLHCGVHIDALAIEYDTPAFLRRFLAHWPEGSPAQVSYHARILGGPNYTIEQARPKVPLHFAV